MQKPIYKGPITPFVTSVGAHLVWNHRNLVQIILGLDSYCHPHHLFPIICCKGHSNRDQNGSKDQDQTDPRWSQKQRKTSIHTIYQQIFQGMPSKAAKGW